MAEQADPAVDAWRKQRYQLYDLIVRDRSLSDAARCVAWVLLDFYNPKVGCAWPAVATIAAELNVDRRTVQRALAELTSDDLAKCRQAYFAATRSPSGRLARSGSYSPILSRLPMAGPSRVTADRYGRP